MTDKCCGNCEHHFKFNDNGQGNCRPPLPVWINLYDLDNETNPRDGKDCPVFKQRGAK